MVNAWICWTKLVNGKKAEAAGYGAPGAKREGRGEGGARLRNARAPYIPHHTSLSVFRPNDRLSVSDNAMTCR